MWNSLLALLATTAATGAVATPAAADYSLAPENHAGSQIARFEAPQGVPPLLVDKTLGHDVSGHQGPVDWPASAAKGAEFVFVKATEGTGFRNPQFAQQYNGSHGAGMIRGAYHFARPDVGPGGPQAHYFIDNGGGWTADGKTLPGALDVEYNPYGETCYGLDAAGMTAWIKDFSDTYAKRTGRAPVIYTSTSWWNRCTGSSKAFGSVNPLWIARYAPEIGPLPAGWSTHTVWQWSDKGDLPGDQNYFNGAPDRLATLARG